MPGYSTIARASAAEKAAMNDLAAGLNHIAEIDGSRDRYQIEKASRQYVIIVQSGTATERGSVVRCATCGSVRELFEGQIEFCDNCEASWE